MNEPEHPKYLVPKVRRLDDKVDALPSGGEALGGAYWYRDGLRDAAAIARDDAFAARQSLSLPASKETPDA